MPTESSAEPALFPGAPLSRCAHPLLATRDPGIDYFALTCASPSLGHRHAGSPLRSVEVLLISVASNAATHLS